MNLNLLFFKTVLFLANYIFKVIKVNSPKQAAIFNEIWTGIWIEQNYHSITGKTESEIKKNLSATFAAYDKYSKDYLLCLFKRPIGTFRIIQNNNEVGLPMVRDFKLQKNVQGKNALAEATLFALKKEFRGYLHLPSLMLMKGVFQCSWSDGYGEILIEADKRFFFLCKKTGLVMNQLTEEKFFEGSVTYPSILNFEETLKALKEKRPILHNFFLK